MKVLILDDEPLCRRAFGGCFLGAEVLEAATLANAIEILRNGGVDLVLADLIVPDSISSANTIAMIRKEGLRAVIVAITGGDLPVNVAECADGVLLKPIRGCPELCQKVMETVERTQARPEYEKAVKAVKAWALVHGDTPNKNDSPPVSGIRPQPQHVFKSGAFHAAVC